MKELRCGQLMPGCDFVAKGDSVDAVMKKAAVHAAEVHGLTDIPPELAAKIQGTIKDV